MSAFFRLAVSRMRWAAVLLVVPLGCGQCNRGPDRNAEEFVDKDATVIVSIPSLGLLADHVDALKSTARAAGNTVVVEWLANLANDRGIGFDAFTRAGQKLAGLDPTRSVAIGGSTRRGGYAALPYSDLDTLIATVKRLGPDRMDASVKETRTINDTSVTVFAATAGGTATFAYASKDRFLIIGAGDSAAENVAAAVKRKPEESAAKAGPFIAAKAKVGTRDIYGFIPKLPPLPIRGMPEAISAGLSIADNDVALRAYFPLNADRAALVLRTLVGGETGLSQLPPGQPAYLRGAIEWTSVAKDLAESRIAGNALEKLRALFHDDGIDLDSEILANLQPGFAVSLGLTSTANVANALKLDPSEQNPFENYAVVVLAQVKDAAKAQALLAKLPKTTGPLGLTIATHDVGGEPVYTAHYELGDGLSWTLHGNRLIAVGGQADHLDAVISGLVKQTVQLKKEQFSPHAGEALFSQTGLALAVDLARLSEIVKELPGGTGPAFMAKTFITNALKNVDHFRPVVAVSSTEGGVMVDAATNIQ